MLAAISLSVRGLPCGPRPSSFLGSVLLYGAISPLYPLDAFRCEFGYSDLSANNGERLSGIVGSRSRIVVDGKLDEFLGEKYGRVGTEVHPHLGISLPLFSAGRFSPIKLSEYLSLSDVVGMAFRAGDPMVHESSDGYAAVYGSGIGKFFNDIKRVPSFSKSAKAPSAIVPSFSVLARARLLSAAMSCANCFFIAIPQLPAS